MKMIDISNNMTANHKPFSESNLKKEYNHGICFLKATSIDGYRNTFHDANVCGSKLDTSSSLPDLASTILIISHNSLDELDLHSPTACRSVSETKKSECITINTNSDRQSGTSSKSINNSSVKGCNNFKHECFDGYNASVTKVEIVGYHSGEESETERNTELANPTKNNSNSLQSITNQCNTSQLSCDGLIEPESLNLLRVPADSSYTYSNGAKGLEEIDLEQTDELTQLKSDSSPISSPGNTIDSRASTLDSQVSSGLCWTDSFSRTDGSSYSSVSSLSVDVPSASTNGITNATVKQLSNNEDTADANVGEFVEISLKTQNTYEKCADSLDSGIDVPSQQQQQQQLQQQPDPEMQSTGGAKSKKKGGVSLSGFLSRNLFSRKSNKCEDHLVSPVSAPGWKLFGKIPPKEAAAKNNIELSQQCQKSSSSSVASPDSAQSQLLSASPTAAGAAPSAPSSPSSSTDCTDTAETAPAITTPELLTAPTDSRMVAGAPLVAVTAGVRGGVGSGSGSDGMHKAKKCDIEVLSTTALILEHRPVGLPSKDPEEEQKHRLMYEQMVEAAKRKEQKEAKQRKRQIEQQLKYEDSLTAALKVWNTDILPNWATMQYNKKALDLWWRGIPPSIRGKVWKLAFGNDLNLTKDLYHICVNRAKERLKLIEDWCGDTDSVCSHMSGFSDHSASREASVELIKLDVSRTFPQLCIFQKGGPYHELLQGLLGAYACYRPDVGYVQGMSFIAAVLLLNMEVHDAFICFANLLNRPCQIAFFRLDESLMKSYFDTYEEFFDENLAKLFSHFQKLNVTPDLYIIDWMFTLYAKSLPLDVASRVWDVFARDGEEFLFRTALGILKLYEDILMNMDFIHLAQFLTRLPDDIQADDLFRCIDKIKMTIETRRFKEVLLNNKEPQASEM